MICLGDGLSRGDFAIATFVLICRNNRRLIRRRDHFSRLTSEQLEPYSIDAGNTGLPDAGLPVAAGADDRDLEAVRLFQPRNR